MVKSTRNRFVDLIFKNVRIVVLLFLFLVIFGTAAFANMQRQGFPEVLINYAVVLAPYPNANALQIEEELLKPIEAVLEDQASVTEYTSIANDNVGVVTIVLDESVDLDAAVAKISDEVSTIDLPEDALDIEVNKIATSGSAFMVGVSGPRNEWDLYHAAEQVRKAFEDIDGVKSVDVMNDLTPEIIITFDSDALVDHGLTREEVEQSLSFAQFELPAGTVVSDRGMQTVVSLAKEVTSLDELRAFRLKDGVALQDVATVDARLNNNDRYNRIGFRGDQEEHLVVTRSLVLSILLEDDADILSVDDEITELFEETSGLPEDASVTMLYSQADSTRDQIKEISSSIFGQKIDGWGAAGVVGYLFGGVTLVLILLFLFMNIRVAILAALAIPLSLLSSAMYLSVLGIGLNTLVLFSMVLAIGLVVDPTIVFLESMQRYKEQGLSGKDAAAKTMNTVGWGVTLAVLTNILVFVPFGIVSGFFGEIISYIPLTIIPAMIASLLVPAIFFTPLASKVLKPRKRKGAERTVTGEHDEHAWFIAKKIGQSIRFLLRRGFKYAILRVLVVVLALALPIGMVGGLVSSGAVEVVQFSEAGDVEFIVVYGDVNDNWTFEKAVYDVVVPLQDEIAMIEEVESFVYFEQSGNDFTILVTLLDFEERKDRDLRTGQEVTDAMNVAFDALGLEAEIEADVSGEGPPQDRFPVQIQLFGDDLDVLAAASDDVMAYLSHQPDVTRVESNLAAENSEGSVTFVLDDDSPLTQNPLFVYSLVSGALGENDLGTLDFDGEEYDVISKSDQTVQDVKELLDLEVMADVPFTRADESTQVNDVVVEERVTESTTIRRINGKRYVQIQAMVTEGADIFAIQEDLDNYLSAEKLSELGLAQDATDFTGTADSIEKSFTELFIALAVAIFLIYVLLVGFFRSFLEPFIILFAIPLGLIGVFGAVAATTGQLGFLELLGVVAMAGIVVNVTILLIDFANQLKRDEGKTPAEAIATSVALRFRPIVLTQLTAFGSLMPLVIYSPFWQGLASSIIFGIISSALLSLFVTPVLYVWAEKLEQLPKRWRLRRKKSTASSN